MRGVRHIPTAKQLWSWLKVMKLSAVFAMFAKTV